MPGYVRYMDDMLLFGRAKADAGRWAREVGEFARGRLGLAIKAEATVLAPVCEGVPFLGFRIWPGVVRLDGTRRRRIVRTLRLAAEGDQEDESVRSAVAHSAHAGTTGLRRSVLACAAGGGRPRGGAGTTPARTG